MELPPQLVVVAVDRGRATGDCLPRFAPRSDVVPRAGETRKERKKRACAEIGLLMETEKTSRKSTRGFASMDPEKQRQIARKGGTSVPKEKRSFSRNRSLAAEAGRRRHLQMPTRPRTTQRQLCLGIGQIGQDHRGTH